jgi:transcriptional regulator with XRE-family HTH domain
MTDFAYFIRQRRLQLSKTQAQVAAACGITAPAITLIESGRRRMALEHIPALAQVLETNPGELCRLALEVCLPDFAAALAGRER